jgi:hypothetical protein
MCNVKCLLQKSQTCTPEDTVTVCLLIVTNKTRAAVTVICTSCRQSTFIPLILHNFPVFCDFRVSYIVAAGYSNLVGGYAVAIGSYRRFGGSYCLHLQGQHEETTIIWNVFYHSQSSRHNILEDSNILHTLWPVSRSSHSNPVPNKQKVAYTQEFIYRVAQKNDTHFI